MVCGLLRWLTAALAGAGSPDWSRPRDLPSLVPLWRFEIQACRAELVDGTLYTLGTDRIVALDARTGARRWESPFKGDCYLSTLVEHFRLILVASGARAPLPEGGALLAFVHPWLGNSRDLWVARLDAEGRLGPSRFLGARRPGTDGCWEKCRLAAQVSGTVLEVRRADADAPPGVVTVDLRDVDQDSHGDGLTDVVEKRLATDPRRADTDGDGTDDAFDRNPTTPRRRPQGEEQEIAADIFQQVFQFERDDSELVVVVSPFALEWRGREDPTLTVPADGLDGFTQRTAAGATLFSVGPVTEHTFFEAPRLEPDERDYAYSLGEGSSWAVVRKVGGHWVIRGVYRAIAR